jgi:hypothetical protein
VDPVGPLEREALGRARGDVDDEVRLPPTLELIAVDQEGNAADLAELNVVGAGRQL